MPLHFQIASGATDYAQRRAVKTLSYHTNVLRHTASAFMKVQIIPYSRLRPLLMSATINTNNTNHWPLKPAFPLMAYRVKLVDN